MKNAAIILQNWLVTYKKKYLEGSDLILLGLVFGFISFGLLMVYSSSFIFAEDRSGDGLLFIKKQLFYALIGFVALFISSIFHYKNWMKFSYPLLLGSTLLLGLVLIPGIGVKTGGAQRWIEIIGFRFQPSEIFKFALIVYVASRMIKKENVLNRFSVSIFGTVLLLAPAFFLLLQQPDLGTVVMTTSTLFFLLFLGGVPIRFLALCFASFLPFVFYLVWFTPYRLARITGFLDPWQDPGGRGFQVLQSLVGVSNGQWTGVGLGNGKEKLFFLPEAHNDFIFAVISEELGFIGVFAVIFAFCFLAYRGFKIASAHFEKNEKFGFLLATGITLMLTLQAFVNIGVVFGIVPTKGLTLPFLSYGGSSLIMNCFAIGVLLNLSKNSSLSLSKKYLHAEV